MAARKLSEVDLQITETREHIEVQRKVVRKFNESGHIEDTTLAQGILRALETSLRILEERRRSVLKERSTAKPKRASNSRHNSSAGRVPGSGVGAVGK
jgi:hypothetical protein